MNENDGRKDRIQTHFYTNFGDCERVCDTKLFNSQRNIADILRTSTHFQINQIIQMKMALDDLKKERTKIPRILHSIFEWNGKYNENANEHHHHQPSFDWEPSTFCQMMKSLVNNIWFFLRSTKNPYHCEWNCVIDDMCRRIFKCLVFFSPKFVSSHLYLIFTLKVFIK